MSQTDRLDHRRVFAVALLDMSGVGQVTAHRVLSHFHSYEELLEYPREQVLYRIKGSPNAEELVKRLFDEDAMNQRFMEAKARLKALGEKEVEVQVPGTEHWPEKLNHLQPSRRPVLLYTYGPPTALHQPTVGFFAQPPLTDDALERAESMALSVVQEDGIPASGIAHGFDTVIQKRVTGTSSGALMVANCGLAKIKRPLRPTVSQAVQGGAVLVSSFPLQHGPFDHDDAERALVQAALSDVLLAFQPRRDTPEWQAAEWAIGHGRPVFGIPAPDEQLPTGARPIEELSLASIFSNSRSKE